MKTKIALIIVVIALFWTTIGWSHNLSIANNANSEIVNLKREVTHLNSALSNAKTDSLMDKIIIIDLQNQITNLKANPIIIEKTVVKEIINTYPVYIYSYPTPQRGYRDFWEYRTPHRR